MFIADPIHLIVEDLASRIKRSVAVDDAALNYIAHSTHRFSDEDQIRVQSITERQLPEPVLGYVKSMNLASLHEPLVVPALHEHGFDNDRLLVPIRSSQELIGVLWTTHHPLLSEDDKRACQQAANRLAPLLQPSAGSSDSVIVERHLHNLVSDDPTIRRTTAEMLISHRLLHSDNPMIVIAIGRPDSQEIDQQEHAELRLAWFQATGRFHPRMLTAHGSTHTFGLLEVSEEYSATALSHSLESVRRYMRSRLSSHFEDLRIGVGSLRSLNEVHISYLEAISAVSMGVDLDDPVIVWDDHALETLLGLVATSAITKSRLPTVLRDTLAQINDEIIKTITTYLDLAGSVSDVAREQHLHRATIYYRINQFERATGLNLKSGRDRLLVHLGIHLMDRIDP
ncbi:PucR family transcriptional regulator [Brevibacterium spongiae]|uniref:Helix-turn-helix domain-containing protein n=1 Tax=Brevibacterium spongiae TaxID=2909672 RepID=A0ABY5SS05_9MICO|nr:helix-turn-helix domain-containing protein [Brevibacterium spongiae]UVI36686.1 helix-turn-helix domain-containing protein [Brevibacterium spongiae]